jgi:peptide/nickel transport system permease protein
MAHFLGRRLFGMAVTLVGVSIITFMLVFAAPTDPARALVGEKAAGVSIEQVRKQYGLDLPVHQQYFNYVQSLLRGDLGDSFYFKQPVSEALLKRFPATLLLAFSIIVTTLLIGIPLGMIAALRSNTAVDRGIMIFQLALVSIPSFFLALLLMYFLAFRLDLFPIGGYGGPEHLVLPTLAVALPWAGWYTIYLRSSLLEVISADYVRTAYAKGLTRRRVLTKHMMRNALLPVITMLGMDMAGLLMGLALVEYIFGWPGIGWQALRAAQHFDIPMIMGTVLLGALIIGVANLLVDILYTALDPRVRLE